MGSSYGMDTGVSYRLAACKHGSSLVQAPEQGLLSSVGPIKQLCALANVKQPCMQTSVPDSLCSSPQC